jgi:hypothetical protein
MDKKQLDLVKLMVKKNKGRQPKRRNAGQSSTPNSLPPLDDTRIQGSGHGGGSGLLEWLKSLPPGSELLSIKLPSK